MYVILITILQQLVFKMFVESYQSHQLIYTKQINHRLKTTVLARKMSFLKTIFFLK